MFKRQLPDILREHERDLEAAFAKEIPKVWPERHPLMVCEQPAAIAQVLIDAIHTDLREASIGYAYRKDMRKGEKIVLATASRGGSKLEFFSGLDLLVMVNWKTWQLLSLDQRVALIDHELCHFAMEQTEHGIEYVTRGHDVEEFERIISRWGLWKPDLRAFAATAAAAHQADLFERQAEAEATR